MVNEFMVKNYRNVSVEKIELGRVNLLIGPNGSGKSSFLRALGFWAKVVQNNPRPDEGTTALYETLSQNGWGRMLNFEADSNTIDFSWVFTPEKAREPYEYKLNEYSITELSPERIADLYGKGFNLGDLYRAKAIEIGGWPK